MNIYYDFYSKHGSFQSICHLYIEYKSNIYKFETFSIDLKDLEKIKIENINIGYFELINDVILQNKLDEYNIVNLFVSNIEFKLLNIGLGLQNECL